MKQIELFAKASIIIAILAMTSHNHSMLDDMFKLAELSVKIARIEKLNNSKKVQFAGRVKEEKRRNFFEQKRPIRLLIVPELSTLLK